MSRGYCVILIDDETPFMLKFAATVAWRVARGAWIIMYTREELDKMGRIDVIYHMFRCRVK